MKILLITPPLSREKAYGKFSSIGPCLPPLGLCYVAAQLVQEGYEVKIVDCFAQRFSHQDLLRIIREYSPDVVGVSATTVSYVSAQLVLQLVKQCRRAILTVLGGTHVSALPLQVLQECPDLDVAVIGEGEYTAAELMECLKGHRPWEEVRGVAFRKQGEITFTLPRLPVLDLDALPYPALHLLRNIKAYSHTPLKASGFTLPLITSRGCPYACSYCDQGVFGHRWRGHSPMRVVQEMKNLQLRYGARFVSFEDDNFLFSRPRVQEICELIAQKGIQVKWACSGRIEQLAEKDIVLMRNAGCRCIYVGIESASQRILSLLNKELDIYRITEQIRLIRKHGIRIYASFMLGLPSETREDIEKTVSLALSLPIDSATFFRYVPYPHTELRDQAFSHGKVSKDWEDYAARTDTLAYEPSSVDREYLLQASQRAYLRFFLRPQFIMRNCCRPRFIKEGLVYLVKLIRGSVGENRLFSLQPAARKKAR